MLYEAYTEQKYKQFGETVNRRAQFLMAQFNQKEKKNTLR